MTYVKKSIQQYVYYNKRDLVYKCHLDSLYHLPTLKQSILIQRKNRGDEIYPYISSLILVFDRCPYLVTIKNSLDKKIIGSAIGTKIRLNLEDTLLLFLRLKYEGFQYDYIMKTISAGQDLFFFKMNNFDEILTFYDQYSMLHDFSVKLQFKNCKNKDEEKLIQLTLSNL